MTTASFIRVLGNRFLRDGKPYRFVGMNFWPACFLGHAGVAGGRARLVRELDRLVALGITNLRICGGSEQTTATVHQTLAMQTAPGVYDEEMLRGLDFALAEMATRGLTAVIYLTNYWDWSGGMSVYQHWTDGQPIPDPTGKGWDADGEKSMNYAALFYANAKAQELYRAHIRKIVGRINTVNGRCYRDDPTIMAWQLSNEPRPGKDGPVGETHVDEVVRWVDSTLGFIKSLDPNHLCCTGSEGKVGCLQNIHYVMRIHQSVHVDYLNVHIWAKNWSWFKPTEDAATYPQSELNLVEHLKLHIQLADYLGKPLTLEEFGIDRDGGSLIPGTPTTYRDRYFRAAFGVIEQAAAAGQSIQGSNIWAWAGEGRPIADLTAVKTSADYLGDPWTEPQGTNTVFDTDASTLAIIAAHAKALAAIA